jgi:hypothetical protein
MACRFQVQAPRRNLSNKCRLACATISARACKILRAAAPAIEDAAMTAAVARSTATVVDTAIVRSSLVARS